MQIWFLSNGSYSLKNCHNPFGKAIQPPPLTAKFRLNTENPYVGLPLLTLYGLNIVQHCQEMVAYGSLCFITLHFDLRLF